MKKIVVKYILKKYSVISFDIFDTLIERNVDRPSDIFKLAGKAVLGEDYAGQFCIMRQAAEKTARKKSAKGEVTLEGIYNQLRNSYPESIEQLMEAEIKQEINSCCQKGDINKLLLAAYESGKRIYLISDMYLPENVIRDMLEKCEINKYEKIYISNMYHENKLSGHLFEVVMNENQISCHNMIHIGDSLRADFIGAHKAGIKAILIARKKRFERLMHS